MYSTFDLLDLTGVDSTTISYNNLGRRGVGENAGFSLASWSGRLYRAVRFGRLWKKLAAGQPGDGPKRAG